MPIYRDFDLNDFNARKPWGTREYQAWRDVLDTLLADCVYANKSTVDGHRHYRLFNPDTRLSQLVCSTNVEVNSNINLASGFTYQINGVDIMAGGMSGSGTIGYVPKFTAAKVLGDSTLTDNGTLITMQPGGGTNKILTIAGGIGRGGGMVKLTTNGSGCDLILAPTGNVCVGSYDYPTEKLQVAGNIDIIDGYHYRYGGSNMFTCNANYLLRKSESGRDLVVQSLIQDDGTNIVISTTNGNITIATSDISKTLIIRTAGSSSNLVLDTEYTQFNNGTISYAQIKVTNSEYTITGGNNIPMKIESTGSNSDVTIQSNSRDSYLSAGRDAYIRSNSNTYVQSTGIVTITCNKGGIYPNDGVGGSGWRFTGVSGIQVRVESLNQSLILGANGTTGDVHISCGSGDVFFSANKYEFSTPYLQSYTSRAAATTGLGGPNRLYRNSTIGALDIS